jgi:peptidase A4-like protein
VGAARGRLHLRSHIVGGNLVGLGGNSSGSNTLEQIGTEIDCGATGQTGSAMWYELVPAAAVPISLAVKPGDSVSASAGRR